MVYEHLADGEGELLTDCMRSWAVNYQEVVASLCTNVTQRMLEAASGLVATLIHMWIWLKRRPP